MSKVTPFLVVPRRRKTDYENDPVARDIRADETGLIRKYLALADLALATPIDEGEQPALAQAG